MANQFAFSRKSCIDRLCIEMLQRDRFVKQENQIRSAGRVREPDVKARSSSL
jgi:hypothetical protein